jgi:hypothetical protein
MLTVTKLRVRSYDLDHLDIFWEILETTEDVEAYDFYVLRSIDGPAGPFEVISPPFYNTYQFRDPNVHLLHKWRTYYYMIRVVHRETQEAQEFGPEWHRAKPDLVGLEIQRRERLMFEEFIGRAVFLFPVLTFGQRCPVCWDVGPLGNTIGRSTNENCATCFDTTWVQGFASPIISYMQIDPTAKRPQKSDHGDSQFVTTTARTSAFPPVKPEDIIVEAENIRWGVEQLSGTEKLRSQVRQEFQLRQLPPSDIRYKLPVDYDLLAEHSPRRAFVRPMDLQEEPLDLPNPFKVS